VLGGAILQHPLFISSIDCVSGLGGPLLNSSHFAEDQERIVKSAKLLSTDAAVRAVGAWSSSLYAPKMRKRSFKRAIRLALLALTMLFHLSILFTLATASLTAAQLAGYATQNGGTTGGAGGTTTTVSAAAAFQTAVKVCVPSNLYALMLSPIRYPSDNQTHHSLPRCARPSLLADQRRWVSCYVLSPGFSLMCYRSASDTTIIGVGTQAILTGVGLKISGQRNIIIRNLVINKVIPFSTSALSLPHRKTGGHRQ
jgi:hypothetical protein